MLPGLIIFCFIAALLLLWLSAKQRHSSGVPEGRIVSSDTSKWNLVEKSLYASAIGLTGKPDYIVENDGTFIPVEVKSSTNPDRGPYDSHVYQLAAYCLLLYYVYGTRPTHGILHYTSKNGKQRTYNIPFTPELEEEIETIIQQIQTQSLRKEADRSHQSIPRCKNCGFNNECDQSLS